jgi:hypothetical protein
MNGRGHDPLKVSAIAFPPRQIVSRSRFYLDPSFSLTTYVPYQRHLIFPGTMIQQEADRAVAGVLKFKACADVTEDAPTKESPAHMRKGPRFWAIMIVLALISLLTSLEATVTSTVLPSIVADLNGGVEYIWISNAYFLVA